jgi:hypothetical protein
LVLCLRSTPLAHELELAHTGISQVHVYLWTCLNFGLRSSWANRMMLFGTVSQGRGLWQG